MRGGSEAVERKSERMDTAYSPRVHEEEPSDAAPCPRSDLRSTANFALQLQLRTPTLDS